MSRSLDALPGFYVKIASQTRPPYESLSLGYLSNLLFFCYQVSESLRKLFDSQQTLGLTIVPD